HHHILTSFPTRRSSDLVLAFAQHYKQTNLVSDLASISTPNPPDPSLKNPWGLTRSPGGSPWWVSNNNSGTSTLYNGAGAAIPIKDRKSTRLNSSHQIIP